MNITHSPTERVAETHDGRTYSVPKRLPHESLRLYELVHALDHPETRMFTVERMSAGHLYRIPVEAMNGAEASDIADEVQYAMVHPEQAEQWARNWPGIVRMVR